MTSEELDRMDATARDGSRWPESTQSRADVLALTAEVRQLTAARDNLREELNLMRSRWEHALGEHEDLLRMCSEALSPRMSWSVVCPPREIVERITAVVAERDALRTAILDLERDDAASSAHNGDCPGRDHAAGESCGWGDEGGWACCEGLSERDCLATERSLCSCGLIAWRDRMRAAGDLARGVRVVEVSRG